MQIQSPADRLAVDELVNARLGGQAAMLRRCLAVLQPQQLVGIWFRQGTPNVPSPCINQYVVEQARDSVELEEGASSMSLLNKQNRQQAIFLLLRKHFHFKDEQVEQTLAGWIAQSRNFITRRSLLFAWVYGPSPAIQELVHVRLPSKERRLLIDLVISGLRRRHPWLKSRHVCAMAFRPESFAAIRSAPIGQSRWGPLYRSVEIQQGSKRRYLWIPNRVLKTIQKSLLRLLQPTVDQVVGSNVFGAKRGIASPTFANAAAHMDRNMIASFDIKDFFPSTSHADVIRGLQHLGARGPLAVDPSRLWLYPKFLANANCLKTIKWTDDLRVFIARIGTHRGRVPQGSPLSPLLANIAFSPYDDLLVKMFNQEWGVGRVKYTRYFDDMTISASARDSMSPAAFREKCEAIITKALAGSSYHLNARKSRSSASTDGHVVTGILVRKDKLNLPRRQRRELRTVLYALKRQDFVKTAYRWRQLAGRPEVKFETIHRGHRFAAGKLKSKRLSAERLASQMLKRLYPDLRLRRLLPDWHPWQELFESAEDVVAGKKMWPLLERVLALLWRGEVQPVRPNDPFANRIVIRQKGIEVCVLEAESTLDFFFLTRDRAIAGVEYWHHLRGMAAYLNGCPEGEPFSRIRDFGKSLHEACANIEVRATPDGPSVVPKHDLSEPLTSKEHLLELTTAFDAYLNEYLKLSDVRPGPEYGKARDIFRCQRATDWPAMLRWLSSACDLTVRQLPNLPTLQIPADKTKSLDLYDYLQGRRANLDESTDYTCVLNYQTKHRIGPTAPENRLSREQNNITTLLVSCFKEACKNLISDKPVQARPNYFFGTLSERLEDQLNDLERLHRDASSDLAERRLFRRESWGQISLCRDEILKKKDQPVNSPQVWSQLEKVAALIDKAIVEAIESAICHETPPKEESFPDDWKRRRIWTRSKKLVGDDCLLGLLKDLRNRAAHSPTPDRRKEWVQLQTTIAKVLGRDWKSASGKKHPTFIAPDDLRLTSDEGQIIQIKMLLVVNEWLSKIVEQKWWLT